MSKSAKDASRDPISLHEQLDQLTAALRDVAKAESAEAIKAASDAARRIAEELAEKADAVAAATSKGRGQVEQAIRDQPLTAVALAAAAGFLLALLVRR
ncbi:MAG: hypothetical protein K2X72_28685 [Reyranella sp.]|nr:hypothetical protein [Reyranella sp.]